MSTNFIDKLDNHKYAVMLSAELASNSVLRNIRLTTLLQSELQSMGLYFYEAIGCWYGQTEHSFVVMCDNFFDAAQIIQRGLNVLNQESVLVLDRDDQQAVLIFSDGDVKDIGTRLQHVSSGEALQCDSYTLIDGHYYIVE